VANVWSGVTIDCLDPERVARFWSALLGREPGPSQEGVINLGGRFTGERHDYDEGVVVVIADPEDHEFCLVKYHG
jgi:predicted enzyme related to lactoylglutathione lyase